MYYTIYYIKTGTKGKYQPITWTTHHDAVTAYSEGLKASKTFNNSDYAGFAIKDKYGRTFKRVLKRDIVQNY